MSWQIDPAHSLIEFTVTHMMIAKVRGRFNNFSGLVELNEGQPDKTSVVVEIEINSIDTRQQQRDDHLRSADFFNVANYPKMKFVSRKVRIVDQKHAILNGDLTIKDITKPVSLTVEFNGISKSPWGSTSAGFSATTKINRKDWALTWNQSLETGGVLVGDEISINIEIELIKQEV
jgi:polyisoprenoid-binding protein YceI